jgi:hypothetical protein
MSKLNYPRPVPSMLETPSSLAVAHQHRRTFAYLGEIKTPFGDLATSFFLAEAEPRKLLRYLRLLGTGNI